MRGLIIAYILGLLTPFFVAGSVIMTVILYLWYEKMRYGRKG